MLLSRSYCHLAVVNTPEVLHLIEDLGLECLTCLDAEKRRIQVALHQEHLVHNSLKSVIFDTSENGSLLAYYHYRKHHKFNPKNDLFYEESGKLFD